MEQKRQVRFPNKVKKEKKEKRNFICYKDKKIYGHFGTETYKLFLKKIERTIAIIKKT